MKVSEKLKTAIQEMIGELNANLPEDSEPQTADGWIANTLKVALADYYSGKIRKDREPELTQIEQARDNKEHEIQNVIVRKRKEIMEM